MGYIVETNDYDITYFTLRDLLRTLGNDIECEIVSKKLTDMAKSILQEEYCGLDSDVEKFEIKDNKLYVWI